jgi:hypothetical protein
LNFSNVSNQKTFFQGALKAAVWGAVSGAVTFGIGEVARTIGNVYFRFIFQAYAHGFYNGIATELQGGKFIHGFAVGAIGSAAATFAGDVLKAGPVGQILAGGVSGGLAAEISGGDFIKGFTTGVIVSAFNHAVHSAAEGGGGGSKDPPKCGDKTILEEQNGTQYEMVFTGDGPVDGWQIVRVIPGSGVIQVTDSQIEWVLGAWKAPLQAVDDIGVLRFAAFMKGGGGKNIFIKGVGEVSAELFHRTIKPEILTAAGKTTFAKIVGKKPDIFVDKGISLQLINPEYIK